jgi:hypothetical protein
VSVSTPEEILAAASAAEDSAVLRATVAAQPDSELVPYTLNPRDRLQRQLANQLASWAIRLAERTQVVPYDPGRKPEQHEIVVSASDEVPGLVALLERIELDAPLPLLDKTVPTRDLGLNLVSVSDAAGEWVHGIRLKTVAVSIGKGTLARLTGTSYDVLAAPPLLFSDTFDAVATTEHVLIAHQYQFENSFDFLEGVRAAAVDTLRRASAVVKVANFDELAEAVSDDRRMLAKLRSVKARMADPQFLGSFRMDRIAQLARSRPDLGIELSGPPGEEQLVFRPDIKHRFTILKLLDDDYLRSLLTDLEYEANSKSRLS